MTARDGKSIFGKWRITGMASWDTGYSDMMGPGYLRIDDDGGEMAFGCITIGLQCEVGESSIWFRFVGADKMDEVSGDGDAELRDNDTLAGEIRFDNGDESSFSAKRW